jgi:hypothetical protein
MFLLIGDVRNRDRSKSIQQVQKLQIFGKCRDEKSNTLIIS